LYPDFRYFGLHGFDGVPRKVQGYFGRHAICRLPAGPIITTMKARIFSIIGFTNTVAIALVERIRICHQSLVFSNLSDTIRRCERRGYQILETPVMQENRNPSLRPPRLLASPNQYKSKGALLHNGSFIFFLLFLPTDNPTNRICP